MSPAPFVRPCVACSGPIEAGAGATWIPGRGLGHPDCAAAVALSSARRPPAPGALYDLLEQLATVAR